MMMMHLPDLFKLGDDSIAGIKQHWMKAVNFHLTETISQYEQVVDFFL
jgi:hypothetical protein